MNNFWGLYWRRSFICGGRGGRGFYSRRYYTLPYQKCGYLVLLHILETSLAFVCPFHDRHISECFGIEGYVVVQTKNEQMQMTCEPNGTKCKDVGTGTVFTFTDTLRCVPGGSSSSFSSPLLSLF